MPYSKENFYAEGNSQEYFFSRTNPLANPANAEILKIKKSCCDGVDIELQAEYGYNGMGQTFDVSFGSATSGIDSRYVKVVITDGLGAFGTAVGTGNVSSLSADVSTLNPAVEWTVSFVIEVLNNASVDCPCMAEYTIPYTPFIGTLIVDTTTISSPRTIVFEADGSTIIADAGTYALGTLPIGSIGSFSVVVKNTGASVLTVSSVSYGSHVLSFDLPNFAGVIYPNQTVTLSGTVDTDLTAGSKTGTIVINSDASNVAVYNVTIGYTLA